MNSWREKKYHIFFEILQFESFVFLRNFRHFVDNLFSSGFAIYFKNCVEKKRS